MKYLIKTVLVDGESFPPGTPTSQFDAGVRASLEASTWVVDDDPTKPSPKKKVDDSADSDPQSPPVPKPARKKSTRKKST